MQVSKQPKCPKVLTENAKSHLGSSGRESPKSLSHHRNPVSHLLKRGLAPCKRVFWESHPRGPKTPFAPSLSTFGHVYGEQKTDKEKSQKGIWWSECPRSVPGMNSGRPRNTRDVWANLRGNSHSRGRTSAGQTGQMTRQIGHVQGTDGTQNGGCPAKILYVYWFFLSLMLAVLTVVPGPRNRNSESFAGPGISSRSILAWDPFDHSEGQFSLHAKKSDKSLEMGSWGLRARPKGAKKSEKS